MIIGPYGLFLWGRPCLGCPCNKGLFSVCIRALLRMFGIAHVNIALLCLILRGSYRNHGFLQDLHV